MNKFNGYMDFVSKYREGSTFFYSLKLEDVSDEEKNNMSELPDTREQSALRRESPTKIIEPQVTSLDQDLNYFRQISFIENFR